VKKSAAKSQFLTHFSSLSLRRVPALPDNALPFLNPSSLSAKCLLSPSVQRAGEAYKGTHMKRFLVVVGVFVCLSWTAVAQTSKNYVIIAKGQGKGSTAFAANLGPTLKANLEDMGLVLASSSDPNFANWAKTQPGVQEVAEDRMVQWISPNEVNVTVEPAKVVRRRRPPARERN
jgi:hypothetical protein